MNSEKVKEIKKALESFAEADKQMTLWQNPIPNGEKHCIEIKYADILTYINELESENERLKEDNRILSNNDTLLEMVALLSKEEGILLNKIAELERKLGAKERLTFANRIELVDNAVKIKLKQFAERLKEKYGKSCSEYYPLLLELTSEQLDETLNEFLKGENNE